jgi:hypothetical protein
MICLARTDISVTGTITAISNKQAPGFSKTVEFKVLLHVASKIAGHTLKINSFF